MRKVKQKDGFSLVELLVAFAIIVIVFAAIVPQFRAIRNSLAGNEAKADIIQNGRVLAEHISRSLAAAKQIIAVSSSSNLNGYITFYDNNSVQRRYMLSGGYVVFGSVGSEAQLAGPVDRFQISCYSLSDFSNPTTDGNNIRLVSIETDFSNAGADRTFTSSVYLQTNANIGGLRGYWKLDETGGTTAADSSGTGNNGTLVYGPTWVPAGGQIDGAIAFDGTDDYVNLGANSSLNFGISQPFTVTAWIKTTDDYGPIVSFRDSTDDSPVIDLTVGYEGANNDPGKAMMLIRRDVDGSFANVEGGEVSDGQWHHVAGVRSSDGTIELFLDGVSQGTGSSPQSGGAITTDLRAIGCERRWVTVGYGTADQRYLVGSIDDVRIYNRALTAAEIAQLANILRYRSFNEYKASYSPASIPISTPPRSAGDLLIAAVATYGDTSTSLSPQAGQGWTLIDRDTRNGLVTLGVWWKIASASEPSVHIFTWSGNRQAYGWMMRFTGHDTANPINDSSTGWDTSSTPTSPAVTTSVNNCLILRLGAFKDDDIKVDAPGLPGHIPITMDQSCDTNSFVKYAGFREGKRSSDGNFVTVSKPTGTIQGDMLVAAVATDGNTWGRLSAPSGWNSITTWPGGPYTSLAVTLGAWWKLAGASEPASYTFSWPASTPEQAYGWIMRFTGTNLTCVGYSYPTYGTSRYPPCPSVTPSGPSGMGNSMILRLGAFDRSNITVDRPGLPDNNAITMDRSSTNANAVSGGAGYKLLPVYGPSGATSFSLTTSRAYVTASPCIWPNGVYGNSCSGGAGYTRQPASGGSETSNFLLGSPKEAVMITIAIAPASQDAYEGSEIKP